ncbi:MAG: hypothetical protein AMXMBFR76_11290 [Pseudomonadota bacterium]
MVCDTEKRSPGSAAIRACTKVVLPAPEGAAMTNRFPPLIPSSFAHDAVGPAPHPAIAPATRSGRRDVRTRRRPDRGAKYPTDHAMQPAIPPDRLPRGQSDPD